MKDIKKKKIVIVALLVIGILLIGLGIYLIFIKKDEGVVDNNSNIIDNNSTNKDNYKVKLNKVTITKSSQNVKINNAVLTMKKYDNSLFVNNAKVYTPDIGDGSLKGYSVYYDSSLDYAIVGVESDNLCGTPDITIAINSKGEVVHLNRIDVSEHPDLPSCLTEIYTKNNKVFAKYNGEDSSTLEQFSYEVEFVISNK